MYHVIDLGTIGIDQHSLPWQVNNAGRVSGASFHVPANVAWPDRIHAFLWTPQLTAFGIATGSIQDLGDLGVLNTFGDGINNATPLQVVGRGQLATGDHHAFRWVEGVGMQDLSNAPAEAWGVNDAGQVVGNSIGATDRAVTWDANGIPTDLASEFSFNQWSTARDINNAGAIIGDLSPGFATQGQAFVIDGSFTILPALGGPFALATAINERGDVVGAAWSNTTDYHPCLWRANGRNQAIDLGTLGGVSGEARDINASGDVVGTSYNANGFPRATLWHGGKIIDLNTQIPVNTGWTITDAYSINDGGLIACAGGKGGHEHALLLVPQHRDDRWFTIATVIEILYGVIAGGPGVVLGPGGVPIPWPPPNPITRQAMAPDEQDVLLALAAKRMAELVRDPEVRTRREIEAVKDLIAAAERMLRDLKRER